MLVDNNLDRDYDPKAMTIFEDLIYVVDYSWNVVYVFTLDGFPIGKLDVTMGDLGGANDMAIRPGTFAPLSMLGSAEIETTAGFLSSRPLDLRDVKDQPITAMMLPDPDRLTAYVIGEVEIHGEMRGERSLPSEAFKHPQGQPQSIFEHP